MSRPRDLPVDRDPVITIRKIIKAHYPDRPDLPNRVEVAVREKFGGRRVYVPVRRSKSVDYD